MLAPFIAMSTTSTAEAGSNNADGGCSFKMPGLEA